MIKLMRQLEVNGLLTFIVSGGDRDFMRPVAIACGNSNRDLERLHFAGGGDTPALRLLIVHDDAEREVDDRGGADKVHGAGFTEISMRDDWATVFAG
jgi:hypothetical protein